MTSTVDSLPPRVISQLRTALAIEGITFRRVGKVNTNPRHFMGVVLQDGLYQCHFTPDEWEGWKEGVSHVDRQRLTDHLYTRFSFSTTRSGPRKEDDRFDGHPVKCLSHKWAGFDPVAMTFDEATGTTTLPHAPWTEMVTNKEGEVKAVPKPGDLIAMIVAPPSDPTNPRHHYLAVKWCVVSEQFLRLYNLLFDGSSHPSFRRYARRGDGAFRKYLMSGNRLMTNSSFRKWRLSMLDCDQVITPEVVAQKYHNMSRYEWTATYVHIYTAMALMIHFGEIPGPNNVPNNQQQNGEVTPVHMKHWDLPHHFVRDVLRNFTGYRARGLSSRPPVSLVELEDFVLGEEEDDIRVWDREFPALSGSSSACSSSSAVAVH